jgi:class 3 adenylate cyclase
MATDERQPPASTAQPQDKGTALTDDPAKAPVQLERRTLTLLFIEHTKPALGEALDAQLEWLAARHHGIRDRLAQAGALVFFADAVDCVRMAMALQRKVAPVRLRMGISTASCQIATFSRGGEAHATLLGAESELAARVAATASAGSILISPSTYALVRDAVHADSRDCLLAEELDTHHQPLASITATPTRTGDDLSTFAGLGC